MKYEAASVDDYLDQVPEDKKPSMEKLRAVILDNLPEGFEEQLSYGMPAYVVPFSIYPEGYHAKAKQPLPFISIASQKNFIAFYHMGIYSNPDLLAWFKENYAKQVITKLDMGKSCIRFKKPDNIPYDLLGELVRKITVQDWIKLYESNVKK